MTRFLFTKQASLTMKSLLRPMKDDRWSYGETQAGLYGGSFLLSENEEPRVQCMGTEPLTTVKEVLFISADPPMSIHNQLCRLLIVQENNTITRITVDHIQPQRIHSEERVENFFGRRLQRGITRQFNLHQAALDCGTSVSYCERTTINFADSAQLTAVNMY